jgi:zinc/manganese transport system substrate-binding protein
MRAFAVLLFVVLGASPAHAKLRIAATVGDLGAIARSVGGPDVDVDVLGKPTQDPHFVDAKPSLVLTLSRADLVMLMGLDLEVGWLPVLLTGSRNGKVQIGNPGYFDCSTVISPKEVPLQKLDRSMGDIHPGGNPHFTTDPENAIKIARALADRLAEIDPDHAGAFHANAEKFAAAVSAQNAVWRKTLEPFKGSPVVTYHKSWIYFADWAGLTMVAFVEPKPGIPPNPSHVANVLRIMKERKVPVILQEEWYSAQTSELLARASGAALVRVPGMTSDGETYLDHMTKVVSAVVDGLSHHGS